MKNTQVHSMIKLKSALPVFQTAHVKDGVMMSTDLDRIIRSKTELSDGLYRIIGGKFLPSPIDVDEFPLDSHKYGATIKLSMDRIGIKRLLSCSSMDETRYVLMGICLVIHEGGITAVATDGRRLAVCEWECKTFKSMYGEYILPHQGKANSHPFFMLMKDKKRNDITLQLSKDKDCIRLDNGEQSIDTKLVGGKYPNYKHVIPLAQDGMLCFDRDAMIQALKDSLPYLHEKGESIRMALGDDELTLTIDNVMDDLHYSASVTVSYIRKPHVNEGEKPLEALIFNPEYMLCLMEQPGEVVYIEYLDELSPMVIGSALSNPQSSSVTQQIDRGYVSVLMPMMVA